MIKISLIFMGLCTLTSLARSQFIGLAHQYHYAEAFQYDDDYELVISNLNLEWIHANAVCHYAYGGWLATLEPVKLQQFAVEAMSETNMNLDSLWISLKRIRESLYWLGSEGAKLDTKLAKCGNNSIVSSSCDGYRRSKCTNQMNCGVIVRANHTVPCFATLNCDALRGFICQRPVNGDNPSTHLGWIKVRHRLYKIFFRQLSYEDANKACMAYDIRSRLAVIETYEDAQALGRYLLVGRPSLEKVWIGAKWKKDHYEFESEPIALTNTTDPSGYPPWRNNAMSRTHACLLLDRHLSNITLFVEMGCNRLQHYMCYKLAEKDGPINVCSNLTDYDWRIYYEKLNWFQATAKCTESAPTGRLAVVERKELKFFIYMMESSKKYLLHVWLGAYFRNDLWAWTYTNHTLPKIQEDGYPPWIVNKTYDEDVEKYNVCLDIDRENSLVPLFYGTMCSYAQTFICQYDKGVICHNVSTTTSTTTISTTSETTATIPTTSKTTATIPTTSKTTATIPTTSKTTATIPTTSKTTATIPTTSKTTATIPTTSKTTATIPTTSKTTATIPTTSKTTATIPTTSKTTATVPTTSKTTATIPTTSKTTATIPTTPSTTEYPIVTTSTTEWNPPTTTTRRWRTTTPPITIITRTRPTPRTTPLRAMRRAIPSATHRKLTTEMIPTRTKPARTKPSRRTKSTRRTRLGRHHKRTATFIDRRIANRMGRFGPTKRTKRIHPVRPTRKQRTF